MEGEVILLAVIVLLIIILMLVLFIIRHSKKVKRKSVTIEIIDVTKGGEKKN